MSKIKSVPPYEISDLLIKLRLSGMSECFDVRNKEAIANQMSYAEFLILLAQDELLEREHKSYERRYKKAKFKGLKTIENFDFKFNPNINQAIIRDLATCRFIKEKNPVIIVGPCGTGKTHISQALGHCALQKSFEVMFTNQNKLSEELQTARAINCYAKKLKMLTKIDLLIIDDFGLKPFKSPQDEDLHEIISERSEIASTIFTSNLSPNEWQHAFPNKLLGAATIDRIQHNAYEILLAGKSFRSIKNNKEEK